MVYPASVITVSTRASTGEYEDTAGPAAVEFLRARGFHVQSALCVSDGEGIADVLRQEVARSSLVITCGGTGISPTDLTPEQTRQVVDREVPGIADLIRSRSWDVVPTAALSRGIAGTVGETLIVNLPGSRRAVLVSLAVLEPILVHAIDQLQGGDHG